MIWQRSFNKLAQEKDVEDFIKKFEELNPYLSKANFISSFISGLKELKILKTTLNQVFEEAKWQEEYFFPWLERISLFRVWEMNAMKAREEGNDVFGDVDEGNGDGDLVDSGTVMGDIV